VRLRLEREHGIPGIDGSQQVEPALSMGGKRLDSDCCIVVEVKNGQLVSSREHCVDLHNWDAFWA
jgi:ketosteroid isomerase-like protein